MEIKKITRTILNVQKNLVLKIHVKLINDDNGENKSFHNEYEYNKSGYIRIDNMPFMTLDLIDKEIGWNKNQSLIITPMNTVHIVKGMERLLDAIYGDEIFAVNKQNKIVIYKDMVEKHTEKLFNIGMNQRLIMKPAILLDHNDVEVEGIIMYLNTAENIVELSIDAFESLVYIIKKVDLFTYSQLLLNYFITQQNNKGKTIKANSQTKKKQSPSKRDVFNKDKCITVGVAKKTDEFDGLGKTTN